MARLVAIDFGQKRTGIAVSDDCQIIANGLETLPSKDVISFLQAYSQKETIECFVVGEPRQMNYTPSESTKYIEPFIRRLKLAFPSIPIHRVDERFTSKIAFQTMIDAGLKKKARQDKELVDKISATLILQTYMNELK